MNEIASVLSMSTEMLYGVMSALCVIAALAIFVHDIRHGTVKPHIWSWTVRISIVAVAFIAQIASGAKYSLALSGTQFVGGLVLLALIIQKQRKFGKLDGADLGAIGLALVGMGVWALSGHAVYAVAGTIVADLAATTMCVRAALVKNTTDSLAFWSLCSVAAIMALLSAHGQSLAITLAPAASLLNACINITTILLVRARNSQPTLLETVEDELV